MKSSLEQNRNTQDPRYLFLFRYQCEAWAWVEACIQDRRGHREARVVFPPVQNVNARA